MTGDDHNNRPQSLGQALTIEAEVDICMPKLPSLPHSDTSDTLPSLVRGFEGWHDDSWVSSPALSPSTRPHAWLQAPTLRRNVWIFRRSMADLGGCCSLHTHRLAWLSFSKDVCFCSQSPLLSFLRVSSFLSFLLCPLVISGRFCKTLRGNADFFF